MFFADGDKITSDDLVVAKSYEATIKEIQTTIQEIRSLGGLSGALLKEITGLAQMTEALNANLVASRKRIAEMGTAIAEATPNIVRMGGDLGKVGGTIAGIAAGSRRAVIAQKEQVEELFAVGQLLGMQVSKIVDDFGEAGYSYERIGDNIKDSILYVQRVGQNAKVVMGQVVENTEKLSRFNFSEGVLGLTKMAAQASRLRFDMKDVFTFADKVLDPDDAVKMASAFQRLGVSVGNLADPFQLMNQSINDPSGLQDSIINVAKSFTYFDEKTKSFKVSPQGILTMRALGEETGLGAENLRKTALAAAEMDDKLKRISTTGLSFDVSEEDKKMIANVASMGKEGEYEVSIKDETGNAYQKKLVDLQEEDFQRLIKQQEEGPKTLQELQQSQLDTATLALQELKAIKEEIKTNFATLPGMMRNMNDAMTTTRKTMESFPAAMRKSGIYTEIEDIRQKLKDAQRLPQAQREREEGVQYRRYQELMSEELPRILDSYNAERQRTTSTTSETIRSIIQSLGLDIMEEGGRGRPIPRPRRANGGIVRGPGTTTSDSIATMLSNGEYVVNAKATSAFLPLLTAINETGLKSSQTEMRMKLSFDEKTPIPAELTVKLPPNFNSLPSYPAFTEYLKAAPDGVVQALLDISQDALVRAGKVAKKGQYTIST